MVHKAVQSDVDMAEALLDIAPRLLTRIGADLPLEDSPEASPGWRDVIALRTTPGQLSVLGVLVEHKCCTMQQLAEHLAVAPSTATAMVKRLLAQGYIERSRDDADQGRLASLKFRLERLSQDERASIIAALPALRRLVEV